MKAQEIIDTLKANEKSVSGLLEALNDERWLAVNGITEDDNDELAKAVKIVKAEFQR